MKNKRILTVIGICTLGAALTFGGCGKEKEKASEVLPQAEPTVAETATPTPAPTATPTPVPLKTLGTKAEGAYEVQIKNATTRPISGVAIKSSEEADFTTQLLGEGDNFAVDEERILYYLPAAAATPTPAEAAGDEKLLTAAYDIRITFGDDGSTVTLHSFPFGDIAKGDLLAADGVGYLNYESVNTKSVIDTKAAELAIVAQQVADAQAAAEAAAAAAAAAEQAYEEPVYEEPYYEEPSYEEPVYEEPSYEEPSYDDNSGSGEAVGGGDGCLDGGLVW